MKGAIGEFADAVEAARARVVSAIKFFMVGLQNFVWPSTAKIS